MYYKRTAQNDKLEAFEIKGRRRESLHALSARPMGWRLGQFAQIILLLY